VRPPGRGPGGRHPAPVQPRDQVARPRARLPVRHRGDGYPAVRAAANAGRPTGKQEETQRHRVETAARQVRNAQQRSQE